MMIETKKPYGSITDKAIQYRFEQDHKFYIVDSGFNTIEIEESEYMKLRCPVRNIVRKRGIR